MQIVTEGVKTIDFESMRRKRRQRVTEEMGKAELDLLVLLRVENIRYSTGLRPGWYPYWHVINYVAVVPREGDPLLLVNATDIEQRRREMPWIPKENFRPLEPIMDSGASVVAGARLIASAVKELGRGGTLGLDMAPPALYEALKKELDGWTIVDGDECMKAAPAIKTEEEIQLMRVSSRCVDVGMTAAINAIKPGVRECEILGAATRAFCELGMEVAQCQSIVASGAENLDPLARFATDKIVHWGELVFMDIGGCFGGMFAEATRTVVCGRPNAEQKRIYRTVAAAMDTILKTLKPGVKSGELVDAVRVLYEAEGLAEYTHLTLLGHSIGVRTSEPPNLGDPRLTGAEFEFQAGMVFSFEPTLVVPGVPGGGTVRIENEILVTEDGCEQLTLVPLDEKLLD